MENCGRVSRQRTCEPDIDACVAEPGIDACVAEVVVSLEPEPIGQPLAAWLQRSRIFTRARTCMHIKRDTCRRCTCNRCVIAIF